MTQNQQNQKKQFSVPSRDQLIQSIKDLDQDIQHVTLNLIKCDFNAKQQDIQKTFPQFNFIKVKNYNPGSFEVVFQMRIDAINFIRNHYDKKILNRRFFIKMGRQQKQVIEQWTGVGSMPKQFRGPNKPHHNQNRNPQHKGKKTEGKTQQKTQENTTEQKPETKPTEVKQEVKTQTKTQQQPKKEGKHIPKFDNQHKKTEYRKHTNQEGEKKKQEIQNKGQQGKKQVPAKKQEKVQQKKAQKQEAPQKPAIQEKKQDDGWIVVGGGDKKNRNKK